MHPSCSALRRGTLAAFRRRILGATKRSRRAVEGGQQPPPDLLRFCALLQIPLKVVTAEDLGMRGRSLLVVSGLTTVQEMHRVRSCIFVI